MTTNQWHILRVEFSGKAINVILDGKRYLGLENDQITGAGAVGVLLILAFTVWRIVSTPQTPVVVVYVSQLGIVTDTESSSASPRQSATVAAGLHRGREVGSSRRSSGG